MKRTLTNVIRRFIGESDARTPAAMPSPDAELTLEGRFVQAAFWMVLGRQISARELRDELRSFQAAEKQTFLIRLLSSPEFRAAHANWKKGQARRGNEAAEERALKALGTDDWFVACAYEFFLGRPADEQGLSHYVGRLREGEMRSLILRSLALSEEFESRYRDIAPQNGFVPRDIQLCELANPAKWDNPEWMRLLQDLNVTGPDKMSMHRKAYEFTQLLYGLERLGRLHEKTGVLSVGAGHEAILYWLANHVGSVVATDLYDEGRWASGGMEGDGHVIKQPRDFAPYPYREDRLRFLKMDGRRLGFRDRIFDVAYSLSSIEHFGGFNGALTAVDEMARVLKPGGLLVLATEYMLSGAPHEEVFTPTDVHALISRPSLRLLQPIDEDVYRRYEYVAVDISKNRFQTPHMVVRMDGTIFTTVMVFLEKA
jgi:SAM-dependent methyltransferase